MPFHMLLRIIFNNLPNPFGGPLPDGTVTAVVLATLAFGLAAAGLTWHRQRENALAAEPLPPTDEASESEQARLGNGVEVRCRINVFPASTDAMQRELAASLLPVLLTTLIRTAHESGDEALVDDLLIAKARFLSRNR